MTSKLNYFEMDKKHRGENWTAEDKEIFIEIMKNSAPIIECKKSDTNTIKRKQAEWCIVQKKFLEQTGKTRGVFQLKGFWRRTRMLAKKTGGERPLSPSQEKKTIEMCPRCDCLREEDKFNSDGIFYENVMARKTSCITPKFDGDDNMGTLHRTQKTIGISRNRSKTEKRHQAALVETQTELKEKTFKLLEEEYALKLQYHRQELRQQELRHKLELEILMIEKEKKEYELKLLKK